MANDWRETVETVLALQDDPDMDTSPGPALQWYPAQWAGDPAVQLMSMEARGIHHHLLMVAWRGFALDERAVPCSLPDDSEMLRALCQHPAGWDGSWPQVARAWKAHAGRLWSLGLCRSYLAQMTKRRAARESAAVRWGSERNANASRKDANASRGRANASKIDALPLHASSSPSDKDKEATLPLAGGEATPPKLNEQALKIQRLEAYHIENGAKPPAPKILARWLKVLGGEVEALAFLADMANRGHLGNMEYCGKVATSWSNGSKPKPTGKPRVGALESDRVRRLAEEAAFRKANGIPDW